MKAKPIRLIPSPPGYCQCSPEEATHVILYMPGPIPDRVIPVQLRGTRAGTGNWSWNGDTEKPTLKPSIKTRMPPVCECCHTLVNDGRVQFLTDCTHDLAGQTLDLLDVDEFPH